MSITLFILVLVNVLALVATLSSFWFIWKARKYDMVQVKLDRDLARSDRELAKADREESMKTREELNKLYLLVQGWTSVNVINNEKATKNLETQSNEVQKAVADVSLKVDALPAKVAEEVRRDAQSNGTGSVSGSG